MTLDQIGSLMSGESKLADTAAQTALTRLDINSLERITENFEVTDPFEKVYVGDPRNLSFSVAWPYAYPVTSGANPFTAALVDGAAAKIMVEMVGIPVGSDQFYAAFGDAFDRLVGLPIRSAGGAAWGTGSAAIMSGGGCLSDVVFGRQAVCRDLSVFAKMIANQLGFDPTIKVGSVIGPSGTLGGHMWLEAGNSVIDTTWGATMPINQYYNRFAVRGTTSFQVCKRVTKLLPPPAP